VILTGPHFGRVRAMFDEAGKPVKEAGPSIPVSVLGLSGVPSAGDDVVVVADERKARELALLRETKLREQKLAQTQAVRMDQIFAQMGEGSVPTGEQKSLNLMIKSDVQGSAEAIAEALRKLPSAEVKVNVLSSAIAASANPMWIWQSLPRPSSSASTCAPIALRANVFRMPVWMCVTTASSTT